MLIAAAFCMYNRYVDGLGTWQPRDEAMYQERGKRVARDGYVSVSKEYLPKEVGVSPHSGLWEFLNTKGESYACTSLLP